MTRRLAGIPCLVEAFSHIVKAFFIYTVKILTHRGGAFNSEGDAKHSQTKKSFPYIL